MTSTSEAQLAAAQRQDAGAERVLTVALLGGGTVGSQVARILLDDAEALTARAGARLELAGIAVRNVGAPRDVELPRELYTTDAEGLVARADLVIELMGGIEPARTHILAALRHGASVVTGNKALLAQDGATLFDEADANDAELNFEAAVAGAIPIIRPIRESLSGDRITRVLGIVNGTTNFILDSMDTTGAQFADVLAEAQRLGYAEADPTADVEGLDAAAKAAILASLAFHTRVSLDDVRCEGITKVSAADIAAAQDAGMTIKLLAIAELVADGAHGAGTGKGEGVSVRVHPTLLPRTHPLAAVHGAYNAVFVEAENAGSLMFYGAGAGGAPTASAIMGDVVTTARRIVAGSPGRAGTATRVLPIVGPESITTSYSVGLEVADQPGVLSRVASVFAQHGVSIETMRQQIHGTEKAGGAGAAADKDPAGRGEGASRAELRFVTHRATEAALAATVADIKNLDVVESVTSVLRVEGV
ncbi:homoserine dehydrogenase [Sinomonas cellulolyticus]|uniref:Homoserine dehydrogenase n=1 Tax=Sinomonas cellulolyticus TaxID=2801916 RepID=A0ABS1K6L7_9MICC|nr:MULTISPECIES: homoserine dehydrogenase [Sinomonas]MBL0706527.1 homoserine dehydrogenase [Sinomonas cellulolyticus]GHG45113.1 homoserine dehydrogenase [Sinomonas sp. KCTC 49339]